MHNPEPYSKIGPNAEFIGAGDEVVVLPDVGRVGILVDATEPEPPHGRSTATVNFGGNWETADFADLAHPDSPQAEAHAAFGGYISH